MDQGTLVEMQIEDGRRFVERLVGEGVPVMAAAWVREGEEGPWFLYLVTPLVRKGGPSMPAYGRVDAVIRKMPQPFRVDSGEVKVIAPNSPTGEAILDLYRQYPGRFPMWYRGSRLGDVSVEGAYIYPPVSAPATRAEDRNRS